MKDSLASSRQSISQLDRALESNAHSLTHFSRNLPSDLSYYSCSLTQLGRFETATSDLTSSIHLADINGLVCIKLFLIVLFYTAPRLRCAALVAGNSLTGP